MSSSRRNVVLTVASAVLITGAAPAAAKIATNVNGFQYDQNTLAFDGTVQSPNKHCVAGRTVTISSVDSGGTATALGTATTDKTGLFSYSAPDYNSKPGTYEATVAATKVKGPKPKHHHKQTYYNCAAGSSGPTQYLG